MATVRRESLAIRSNRSPWVDATKPPTVRTEEFVSCELVRVNAPSLLTRKKNVRTRGCFDAFPTRTPGTLKTRRERYAGEQDIKQSQEKLPKLWAPVQRHVLLRVVPERLFGPEGRP
jgi:hypothetical protein